MNQKIKLLFLISVLLGAAGIKSGAGDLDTTFGSGGTGLVTTAGTIAASGVAIQSNGQIVVVGQSSSNTFAVARYNTSGALDTSFNSAGPQPGLVTTAGTYAAYGVAIQSDGQIVVVGQSSPDTFAVARYNTNGTLDTSFNSAGPQPGLVTTANTLMAQAVAIQGDKIVVVGGSSSNTFAVARYNTSGNLDTTFGGTGLVTTAGTFMAYGVAIQSDNKIVVVGEKYPTGFAVARYNTNGNLDTNFGSGGLVTTTGTYSNVKTK